MKKPINIIITSVLINLIVTALIVGAGANYLANQLEEKAKQAVNDIIHSAAETSDDVYGAVLDFREACGDHTDLFELGIPKEALESPEAFRIYYEESEQSLMTRIGSLYATLDSPFFQTFDSSYLDELKLNLKTIYTAMKSE